MKYLVIVESKSKCSKIKSILEKNYSEHSFDVFATSGHIVNLKKNTLSIDLDTFEGKYDIIPEKKKIVSYLKNCRYNYDIILVATDLDLEGERIAFDVMNTMYIDINTRVRMIFNEITENGIVNAFENLTFLNMNKVHAQMARRKLDRIIGFQLSSITKKHFDNKNLTAGRVLSITTKFIKEKTTEYRNSNNYEYKIYGNFFDTAFDYEKIYKNIDDVDLLFNELKDKKFYVTDIKKSMKTSSPPKPFITATLLQTSPYGIKKTGDILQKLYQKGLITYIRTDSYNMSDFARNMIGNYIDKTYGNKYLNNEKYREQTSIITKNPHECIRPTDIYKLPGSLKNLEERNVYSLIHTRSLAYMMSDCIYELQTVYIDLFHSSFKNYIFDGYKILNPEKNTYDIIKNVKQNDIVNYTNIYSKKKYENVQLFTEGGIIKKLKEHGIGKPSTFINTIDNILEKGYSKKDNTAHEEYLVTNYIMTNNIVSIAHEKEFKETQTSRIMITDDGIKVTEFLEEKFPMILNYDYTRLLERKLSDIENGSTSEFEVLKFFYDDFKDVINVLKTEQKVTKKIVKKYTYPDYLIYKNIKIIKLKTGTKVTCNIDGITKLIYSNIPKNVDLDTINVYKYLPKNIGIYKDNNIIILDGFYNKKYIKWMNMNIPLNNIKKIDYSTCVELINNFIQNKI